MPKMTIWYHLKVPHFFPQSGSQTFRFQMEKKKYNCQKKVKIKNPPNHTICLFKRIKFHQENIRGGRLGGDPLRRRPAADGAGPGSGHHQRGPKGAGATGGRWRRHGGEDGGYVALT